MKLKDSRIKTRLKKSLAIFMAFCISSTWVPMTVFAAEEDRNIRIDEISKPDNAEGTNPSIDNYELSLSAGDGSLEEPYIVKIKQIETFSRVLKNADNQSAHNEEKWVGATIRIEDYDPERRLAAKPVAAPEDDGGAENGESVLSLSSDDGTFTYWGVMPDVDKPSKSELYYIDYADENTSAGIYVQFVLEPLPAYEIILSAESSESIEYQGDSDGELSVKNYTDESSADWFSNAVTYAVENGLFSGTNTEAFSSKTDMSRAMFVTMLGRIGENAGLSTPGYFSSLSEGDSGTWYADYV